MAGFFSRLARFLARNKIPAGITSLVLITTAIVIPIILLTKNNKTTSDLNQVCRSGKTHVELFTDFVNPLHRNFDVITYGIWLEMPAAISTITQEEVAYVIGEANKKMDIGIFDQGQGLFSFTILYTSLTELFLWRWDGDDLELSKRYLINIEFVNESQIRMRVRIGELNKDNTLKKMLNGQLQPIFGSEFFEPLNFKGNSPLMEINNTATIASVFKLTSCLGKQSSNKLIGLS